MSTDKIMIEKQIIKTTFDIITIIDEVNGISETVNGNATVIFTGDKIKDLIEEKTNIHLNRSHEIIEIEAKRFNNNPDYLRYKEAYKNKGNEIRKEQLADIKSIKNEEFKEKLTGVIAAVSFISVIVFIFKIIEKIIY